jgi:hypothetical protein
MDGRRIWVPMLENWQWLVEATDEPGVWADPDVRYRVEQLIEAFRARVSEPDDPVRSEGPRTASSSPAGPTPGRATSPGHEARGTQQSSS